MAQIKPTYEVLVEFNNIATKLVDKYPGVFAGIEVDEIRCYSITNKERPEKKKIWELKAISQPIRIDCPYGWYAVVYSEDWESFTDKLKSRLVAAILLAVGEEGKVNTFDLKDYSVMVRTFGVDYLEDDTEGPDPLNEEVDWIFGRE